MNILVNGKARDVTSQLLSDALAELGYLNAMVATAVNGEFVSASVRAATTLQTNDQLEVVAPMQGG